MLGGKRPKATNVNLGVKGGNGTVTNAEAAKALMLALGKWLKALADTP